MNPVILFILNLLFPHLVGVGLDTQNIIVAPMYNDTVPTTDDTFGYIDTYNAPVFVAHDKLAGDHIEEMKTGDDTIKLLYSNGTYIEYERAMSIVISDDTQVDDIFTLKDAIYFQTCEGNDRLVVVYIRKR